MKISSAQRTAIRALARAGTPQRVLAERYGVSVAYVSMLKNDKIASRIYQPGFGPTNDFVTAWEPRPERLVAVLPASLPGSTISPPTKAQLTAGR